MIAKATAAAQVLRLSALPYWNATTAEHRAELIDVLTHTAVSEAHAVEVVSEFVNDIAIERPPSPAELRAVLHARRPAPILTPCPKCQGSGWIIREFLGPDGSTLSNAAKCLCRTAKESAV